MEQATNLFQKGLLLDTNPMVQGNDTLTDCLNGTIVTMNGNEVILQNDMGNRRVDMAFLPSGYQPVGMKEYGGVIYVASYNPITNKSLLGSFPSPLRLIGDLKDGMGYKGPIEFESEKGPYGLSYLKVDSKLFPLTLEDDETVYIHAGDKFVVYGSLNILTRVDDSINGLYFGCNCNTLNIGETCTSYKPFYKNPDGTTTEALNITWSSSNTEIAEVDLNGVVTAIAEGEVDIIVTDGTYTSSCHLIVSKVEICYIYKIVLQAPTLSANDENINCTVTIYRAINDGSENWQIYNDYIRENLVIEGETHVGKNTSDHLLEYTLKATYTEDNACGEEISVSDTITVIQEAESIDCVSYNISIDAPETVTSSATSINYTVTATKTIKYSSGTLVTETLAFDKYEITGNTNFDINTDTNPRTLTIRASIKNPVENQCQDSITSVVHTFTLSGRLSPNFNTVGGLLNIDSGCNGGIPANLQFSTEFIRRAASIDDNYILIASNIPEDTTVHIVYWPGCNDENPELPQRWVWFDDNGSNEVEVDSLSTLYLTVNDHRIMIITEPTERN